MLELQAQVDAAERPAGAGNRPARKAVDPARAREELQQVSAAFDQLKGQADALEAKAAAALAAGRADEARQARAEAARLHAPPIRLDMTFNIYRTTKGRLGEPVQAEVDVTNPRTGANWRDIIPIREYYTNKRTFPASLLAGSRGDLRVEVRCISVNQYLGMAESDLYILANAGDFGTNFFKGLFGVWLQAMVLTAIGVFAGTFLSWPVALLTTIAFFVGGQVAFSFLLQFTQESLVGGGPFVSLIRLLTHDNQTSELTPTFAVVAAKTLDALVMPVMARLVYLVPNFSALDVSNTVADGFAVSWGQMHLQLPPGAGVCPAVLARRIFHLEESGGRRMRTAPNQNRKIIYGLVIVALFGAMLPYSQWLNREKSEKDLGEAAIGQVDTGSFMLKLALLGGAAAWPPTCSGPAPRS